jgi:glutaminyl-peptide cyclotransferase
MRAFFAALVLLLWPVVAPARVPIEAAKVVRVYPHDSRAYTEGLFYLDGSLYESTGEVGRSGIRKVDLATGATEASMPVNPPHFGEGIVPWKDEILSLTWQEGLGFRWSRDGFRLLGTFHYPGEGWALTSDGKRLIMSDGTPTLRFIDPGDFHQIGSLKVTADGKPVEQLNELEYVDGEILANVWLTDRIARIDPATGHVIDWIDVSALHNQAGVHGQDQVPNGIAWDAAHRRLFVTGKEWPYLFQIVPPKDDPAPRPSRH